MPQKEIGCTDKELQERELSMLTKFFKVLGNPTRVHILFLLMEREACVSELANRLGMTQSAVSKYMNILIFVCQEYPPIFSGIYLGLV